MLGHVRAIAMFPRLSGEESLISTLAHGVNRHEIPWLVDTTVQRSCYDVTISLLFAMFMCHSLSIRPPMPWMQSNDFQTTAESVCEVRV